MRNFLNLLAQLRDLSNQQNRIQGQAREAILQKISQLKQLNSKVYMRVRNPYLRLFFQVFIESHFKSRKQNEGDRTMANILISFNRDYVINLFDYIAICCKYLDSPYLKEVLDEKIRVDIEKGNL